MQALARFERLRLAVVVTGAAAVLAGVAVLASGARLLSPASPLLLAAVAAAVYFYRRLSDRVQAFHFVDYQHALR